MPSAVTSAQLAHSPVFGPLPASERERLAAMMLRRPYRRGQTIFHQDDPAGAVYLIETGRVKVVLITPEGEDLVLRVLGEGEIFGELALLDGQPRSASVVALEDTVTHVLEREAFLTFLRANPDAALDLFRALAELVRRLTEQVEDLAVLDVPGRLARKLLELADAHGQAAPEGILIDVRLTQSELASMIGTSRVSVNHYLALLEGRAIIRRDGQRILLRRPEALKGAN